MLQATNPAILRTVHFTLIMALSCCCAYGKVIYVDDDAAGASDGTSWASAYVYLQDALADANESEKPVEIRVAQGIYRPDQGSGRTPGDRASSFHLMEGVALKGGYAGADQPDPRGRDITLYETVLSGDLAGDDEEVKASQGLLGEPTRGENSYCVVRAIGVDETAVSDGLTITAGNANGLWTTSGGGLYCAAYGTPLLVNCTFTRNSGASGGAMCNDESSPRLIDCTFSDNSATRYGGAIADNKSSPRLSGCTFTANSAHEGGAMHNSESSPVLTSCTFTGNSAVAHGGAICGKAHGSLELSNCEFSGNAAGRGARGGGVYGEHGRLTMAACTFERNSAWDGGAVCGFDNAVAATNCAFVGNSAHDGGGIYVTLSQLRLENCVVSGNVASWRGGGLWNSGTDTRNVTALTHCTFAGNSAAGPFGQSGCGGAIYNFGNVTIANCILWGNYADLRGTEQYDDCWGMGTESVTFSCIQDATAADGDIPFGGTDNGNTDSDPLFVDAKGPDGQAGTRDDDLRLSSGSYCIDAGDNEVDASGGLAGRHRLIGVDKDGNRRRFDDPDTPDRGKGDQPIVDMGAYEFGSPRIPARLFVDPRAAGMENGTTWADAFTDVHAARRTAAASLTVREIRVAQGRYMPDANGLDDPRQATFRLINGVNIIGGYAGISEADPNEYDPDLYRTILSGDLNGDDLPVHGYTGLAGAPNRIENCYHVVTGSGADESAALDSVVITAGNADGESLGRDPTGGGMYCSSGSPTLRNCTFTGNTATSNMRGRNGWAGGMYNDRSSPTLTNCTFKWNVGDVGGGMVNARNSTPTLLDCAFESNADCGVGNYDSNPTVVDCTFAENSGGGMSNVSSNPVLTGCVFRDNSADKGSGVRNISSNPTLIRCVFSGNHASDNPFIPGGGAVYNDDSRLRLIACQFDRNTAANGGAIYEEDSDATLIMCTFTRNTAGNYYGGAINTGNGTTRLERCIFSGNSASRGGGLYSRSATGDLILVNCIFAGNSASTRGGGVYVSGSRPLLRPEQKYDPRLSATNCILWGNQDRLSERHCAQLYVDDDYSVSLFVTFSCIQDDNANDSSVPFGGSSSGNIDGDPLFANPAMGDYHLSSAAGRWDPVGERWVTDGVTSPCIDAGDPNSPVREEPVPNGGRINMGAYGGTAEASKSP